MERFLFKKSRKFFSISDIGNIHPPKLACQAVFSNFFKKIFSVKQAENLNFNGLLAYVPFPGQKKT
jgi:hypothetical protein